MSQSLILLDFDETYYKHNTNNNDLYYLKEMEALLEKISNKNSVITAILTGSTINSVLEKMKKVDMSYKPKHIFSDLSSKMFTWNNNEYVESDEYREEVLTERFLLEDILEILNTISLKHKVEFIPQRVFRESETLYNFYFYSTGNTELDVKILKNLIDYSKTKNYMPKFNRCNPLAGDPENAYDVDFTPKNAGKLYATKFLMKKYNISKKSIIGFGDSGNDEEFLSYLKHAFIMSNSKDEEIKKKFPNTKYPYYKGIYKHVSEFIGGKYD
ncbi:HAD family hydrolase [Staphylococcus schleiferi]|uniref:HAD-IIB family hydrolase n=1 Tax=Staphylococcus coagulans TaxID=74706 RepID=UPI0006BC4909|nr:HAD-IIB family hydrolase [Staphylococcus coagulans]MDR9832201.1 HAD-IIB family hydrolase [Staphylococcus coagulans]BAS46924.1 HAD family hydrolase [Staphylococcus schleiferi]